MSEPQFDITTAPEEELLTDLRETRNDIMWCELGLATGVTRYGGPSHDSDSVQERLEVNRKIEALIEAELARRKQAVAA